MYLDSRGNVTAAIGQMIPNLAAARALPFRTPDLSGLADEEAIGIDFFRVRGMATGWAFSHYASPKSPRLLPEDMLHLLKSALGYLDKQLPGLYPDYADFPDAAKLPLLDMIYNLGETKLRDEYIDFNAAVLAREWTIAAVECHRNGPNEARNDWTKAQFNLAAREAVAA
jgi:hypothetical protein